jgi:hypothetical protein
MIRARRGLIVEVTENDLLGAGGNPLSQIVKLALKVMALNMATELKSRGVAAVAITPGFLRSEKMLENFGVSEEHWRDGAKKDKNFLESETPLFVGRAVAALAADRNVLARSGHLWSSWELARHYGFTDVDGRRPDWGALSPDLSGLPRWLVELLDTGFHLQLEWLTALAGRTERYIANWRMPARRRVKRTAASRGRARR